MEDYEINDVRNRRNAVLPLINIDIEAKNNMMVYFKVSNIGLLPALDVSFTFPPNILWMEGRKNPTLFERGTKYFPPNKTYHFLWNFFPALFHSEDESVRKCDATVTYLHPQTNNYISDTFHIDLESYREASVLKSETMELKDSLKELFDKLTKEVSRLNRNIEQFTSIGGNTGLDLSVTTLRNLRSIVSGDGSFEKLDPNYCGHQTFQEVLNIDTRIASNIEDYFRYFQESQKLEDVEGITPEIIAELKKHFYIAD